MRFNRTRGERKIGIKLGPFGTEHNKRMNVRRNKQNTKSSKKLSDKRHKKTRVFCERIFQQENKTGLLEAPPFF